MERAVITYRHRNLGFFVVLGLSLLVLLAYMGLWRGIWFDELLHFAVGGMSFEYVIKTIDYTTTEVNHGQTGIYILLDWLILQLTGASAIGLRLPSLISAGIMLVAAAVFIRAKGFDWRWQFVAVAALGANSTLMFFTGEARPYMPMAASAMAMLAFYALPLEDRRRWWSRTLAIFGFIFGSMIHPYWILLWVLIAAFSLVVFLGAQKHSMHLKSVVAFLAPLYVVISLSLFAVIGSLTWMRRVFAFGGDTSTIYNWQAISSHFLWDHFAFVPYYMPVRLSTGPPEVSEWVMLLILSVVVLALIWQVISRRCRSLKLLPPLLLLGLAVASSIIVTFQSYRLSYWIIERQWVAGMGLSTVAITWFFAEWWRNVANKGTLLALPVIVYLVLLAVAFSVSLITQVQLTVQRALEWEDVRSDTRSIAELIADPGEQTYNYDPKVGYEYMANLNIHRGGPVWEEFVGWYNKWAGMRPEFRETNPGWSRFIWPDAAPEAELCIPQLCPQ